jgi:hypothetical protein
VLEVASKSNTNTTVVKHTDFRSSIAAPAAKLTPSSLHHQASGHLHARISQPTMKADKSWNIVQKPQTLNNAPTATGEHIVPGTHPSTTNPLVLVAIGMFQSMVT